MAPLTDSLPTRLTPVSFVPARTVVLVGLMGSGKTSVGWRLAQRLALPFRDADAEIEQAAGLSIPEIFARHGEAYFRDGERRVLARLLNDEPIHVLATGGGGFLDPRTRALIAERGISVWLRVGLDELVRRTARRKHRPLLNEGDPRQILDQLIEQRYPIYATADIAIDGSGGDAETIADHVLKTLSAYHRSHPLNRGSPSMSVPACAEPVQLKVALGERAYPILVGAGLLERAGEWIRPLLKGRDRTIVVTDPHVGPRHLPRLAAGLAAAGIRIEAITMPAGEAAKSWSGIETLVDRLLECRVDRGDLLLALGGGVIGDLAGFAAAITMRGLDFVQIPTSLLAQVDSSVGGKTGINTRFGKNLVGSFHQPRLVLADLDCIATLPPRELRAGYAEIVKHAVLGDLEMFSWLESGGGAALLAGNRAALAKAVHHSCSTKAAIVAADERESGGRALLNFGHTFGHALEAETGFSDRLLHGEAVAIGMVQALDLSARLGLCPLSDKERLVAHLIACGLPVTAKACGGPFDPVRLLAHMRSDKKAKNGVLTFILATGLGSATLREDVPESEVLAVLTETCRGLPIDFT